MEAVIKSNKKRTLKSSQANATVKTGSLERKGKKSDKKDSNSLQVDRFDTTGKIIGQQKLSDEVFGITPNKTLIAQALRIYLANQRLGTVRTKTRGEVTGSTRKIYRQKGTGRARHGGIRAPLFVGGGITHGPKPHDHSMKMPQKMRQKALASILSVRLQEKKIMVISGLEKLEPKTKAMVNVLKSLALVETQSAKKLLLVIDEQSKNVVLAARNIEGISITDAYRLNTYNVLTAKHILFMENAIMNLEKRFKNLTRE